MASAESHALLHSALSLAAALNAQPEPVHPQIFGAQKYIKNSPAIEFIKKNALSSLSTEKLRKEMNDGKSYMKWLELEELDKMSVQTLIKSPLTSGRGYENSQSKRSFVVTSKLDLAKNNYEIMPPNKDASTLNFRYINIVNNRKALTK